MLQVPTADAVRASLYADSLRDYIQAAWPLVDLDAPGSFDVALALAGDALVFDDVGVTAPGGTAVASGTGAHRVRRAAVEWHR